MAPVLAPGLFFGSIGQIGYNINKITLKSVSIPRKITFLILAALACALLPSYALADDSRLETTADALEAQYDEVEARKADLVTKMQAEDQIQKLREKALINQGWISDVLKHDQTTKSLLNSFYDPSSASTSGFLSASDRQTLQRNIQNYWHNPDSEIYSASHPMHRAATLMEKAVFGDGLTSAEAEELAELGEAIEQEKEELKKKHKEAIAATEAAQEALYDSTAELEQIKSTGIDIFEFQVPVGGQDKIVYNRRNSNELLQKTIILYYGFFKVIITTLVSVMIVWGGIEWASSGGNPERIKSGRNRIVNAFAALALFIVLGLILQTINPEFFGEAGGPESTASTQ